MSNEVDRPGWLMCPECGTTYVNVIAPESCLRCDTLGTVFEEVVVAKRDSIRKQIAGVLWNRSKRMDYDLAAAMREADELLGIAPTETTTSDRRADA